MRWASLGILIRLLTDIDRYYLLLSSVALNVKSNANQQTTKEYFSWLVKVQSPQKNG